jgi:hypothetical protein
VNVDGARERGRRTRTWTRGAITHPRQRLTWTSPSPRTSPSTCRFTNTVHERAGSFRCRRLGIASECNVLLRSGAMTPRAGGLRLKIRAPGVPGMRDPRLRECGTLACGNAGPSLAGMRDPRLRECGTLTPGNAGPSLAGMRDPRLREFGTLTRGNSGPLTSGRPRGAKEIREPLIRSWSLIEAPRPAHRLPMQRWVSFTPVDPVIGSQRNAGFHSRSLTPSSASNATPGFVHAR